MLSFWKGMGTEKPPNQSPRESGSVVEGWKANHVHSVHNEKEVATIFPSTTTIAFQNSDKVISVIDHHQRSTEMNTTISPSSCEHPQQSHSHPSRTVRHHHQHSNGNNILGWIALAWNRLVSALLLQRRRRKSEKQKLRPPSAKTFFMGTDSVNDDASNEDDDFDEDVEWDWISATSTDSGNLVGVEPSNIFHHRSNDVDVENVSVHRLWGSEEVGGSSKRRVNVHSQHISNEDSHSSVSVNVLFKKPFHSLVRLRGMMSVQHLQSHSMPSRKNCGCFFTDSR
jgi:hypothetical protein